MSGTRNDAGQGADLVSVYVTIGDEAAAKRLAGALLERRLIACANMWPIRSLYRWEGRVQDDGEVAMWLKTTGARQADVVAAVVELHPYDVPCVEVFPAAGVHAPFRVWVHDETRSGP